MSYEAQIATDTLSVAWLRGVFRHDARASQAAFRDYVSCPDDVYADEGPSGVPPPVHESSHRDMLTYACCASLVRLCYTLKGDGVELTCTYRQACLAVLVAGQRSQASVDARGAVNVPSEGV